MSNVYSELGLYILVACLAYIFRGMYCFSVAPLFFYKHTRLIPLVTIISGISSIFLYWFFVSQFGLAGAVLGVFFTFSVTFGVARYLEIKMGYKVDFLIPWKSLTGMLTALLLPFYLSYYNHFLPTLLITFSTYFILLSSIYFFNIDGLKRQILQLKEVYLA